jgi:hypothetical protein
LLGATEAKGSKQIEEVKQGSREKMSTEALEFLFILQRKLRSHSTYVIITITTQGRPQSPHSLT